MTGPSGLNTLMRAAVYHDNSDIRIEEMPVPGTGDGELLVRVVSSGICGSDVMEWYRIPKAPLVLGHEIAGVVEKARGDVPFEEGDRVFAAHHVPCGECRWCAAGMESLCDTLRSTNFDPGGFAEYVRVPAINVEKGTFLLPDEISFDEGAFVEPLACVSRSVRLSGFEEGMSSLVIGSGISGLLHIKLLRALGAGRIAATDIDRARLDAARDAGADISLNAAKDVHERLAGETGGEMFDVVFVCAGAPAAVRSGLESAGRGGTVMLFAPLAPDDEVPVPLFRLWRDQVTVRSTYAGCPVDSEDAIGLLASGRVEVEDLITHILPLERAAEGFRLVAEGGEAIKVIIRPGE